MNWQHGLSIDINKIEEFKEAFERESTYKLKGLQEQIIDIDLAITYRNLNISILKDLHRLKPYGQSNKEPLFLYKSLRVQAIRTIKDEKHLKLTLRDDKYLLEALAFSQGNRRDEIKIGDKIDVICNVDVNTYNTPKTIQLIIQDFKKAIN